MSTSGREGLRSHRASIPVGLEPVAVAARTNSEVWVVNHISDSVSIVNVGRDEPNRVTRTPLVGDEPRDIPFAGPQKRRAFITTAHRGQNSPVDPQLTTPGVSLSTSGVLNGVPTPAGTYHFTPLATDPSSGCGAVRDYTLTVE